MFRHDCDSDTRPIFLTTLYRSSSMIMVSTKEATDCCFSIGRSSSRRFTRGTSFRKSLSFVFSSASNNSLLSISFLVPKSCSVSMAIWAFANESFSLATNASSASTSGVAAICDTGRFSLLAGIPKLSVSTPAISFKGALALPKTAMSLGFTPC